MLSSDSFSPESIKIHSEIQLNKEDKVFLIENLVTKKKYLQKSIIRIIPDDNLNITRITQFPGLLPVIGFNSQPNPSIIMEYEENGTLRDFILKSQDQNNSKFNFTDTKKYINILGIAYTIQYLHGHNIFIQDIDSTYIFLDENLYPHILITPTMNDKTDYFITWPKDVLAFSLIAYEIITGQEATISTDENGENRPDLTIIRSEYQKLFLQKCWSKYDTQRPNIFEIIKMLEDNKEEFGHIDNEEVEHYQKKIQSFLVSYSKDVKKSASEKVRDWCYIYGNMLTNGYGVSTNKLKAAKYYKIAADQGHVSSIFNYAMILDNISGFFSKKKEANRYYKLACEQGHSTAIFNYALMLYNGEGIELNKSEAARYFKFSADLGNSNSMFNIAFMLEKGEGIESNIEQAVHYYKMSADHGNITAMNSFASLLKKGNGINKNKKEAAFYFKTAADLGNSSAMFNYAFMLKTGNGIDKNSTEAVKYFKLAADQGNNSAVFNLALMLYNGDGVDINKKEAARCFKIAADNGNVDAMFNYALMIKNGDGVDTNKREAIHYFKMAANKGNQNALNQYRKLTQFIRASI